MRRRRRVRKTPRARVDIDRIALWIAQNSGSAQAGLRWLDALDEKFEKLASAPGTGRAHPDIHPHVRSSPFGAYVIYFRSVHQQHRRDQHAQVR